MIASSAEEAFEAGDTGDPRTYWEASLGPETAPLPELQDDLRVDVLVIGAGIVGLTAAEALARAGKSVAVLEALRIGRQATGRSTAKVSSQHGLIYTRLIRDFGEERARLYAQANQAAIAHIAQLIDEAGISCLFQHKAAYAYAETSATVGQIQDEVKAATQLGLPAHLDLDIPSPVAIRAALRFDDQAQFNPVQYLSGLARHLTDKVRLFENTRVSQVEKITHGYRARTVSGRYVEAADVIVATQLPVVPDGLFFTKAYPFSHSVIAAPVDPERAPDGMFINTETPSHSYRVDTGLGRPYLIAGGPSYKSGVTAEQRSSFQHLERFIADYFGITEVAYRWTNEDFQSMDGLPFIGRAGSSSSRLYVATGFNAWGISNGTQAGLLLTDLIMGRRNLSAALFDATRIKPLVGGKQFIKENLQAAKHFVGDRLHFGHHQALELDPGQATVMRLHGENVAAYREEGGALHAVSAVCTHLGCLVGWNPDDKTWDCPCHGSRFNHDGAVLYGPATTPLKKIDLPSKE